MLRPHVPDFSDVRNTSGPAGRENDLDGHAGVKFL
jgi:hypothetical protein